MADNVLTDEQGRPLDANDLKALEIHRRRRASPSPEPCVPGWQVHAFLLRLEEIRRREGDIDKERVFQLLQRRRAGETV